MHVTGTCYALFVHDVGQGIDLDGAERRLLDARRRGAFKHKRRAPGAETEAPPALHLVQTAEPVDLGVSRTGPAVDVVLYESGAVSVTYALAVAGDLEAQVALSDALYDNDRLLEDSRRRVADLMERAGPTVQRPALSDLVEDYVMFELVPDGDLSRLWTEAPETVARMLRAEPGPLSADEVADALSARTRYGPDDAVVADWFAALLLGRGLEDERWVLELATVELLELRLLDQQLDRRLDEAYEALLVRPGVMKALALRTTEMTRMAQMQADAALLYEGITNALKLLGDQYLARVHRAASQRFHLEEWDRVIERKLATLDSIYGKLADRTTNLRMETLEWIIIVLIAVSIGVYFVPLH